MTPEDLALIVGGHRADLLARAPKRRIPEAGALSVRSRAGVLLVRMGLRLIPARERCRVVVAQ